MFAQGTFFNSGVETPEQLAAKRAAIQAMMPQYGSARYVGQGLGQLATGIAAGRAGKKLDKIESEKRKQADASFFGILGYGAGQGAGPAGFSAPPRDPMAPESIGADAVAAVSKGPNGIDFGAIEKQYGLPSGYLPRTATIESNMNPDAQNPNSSAGGLFQFIDSTAAQYGLTDKTDAAQSTVAAARLAADNAKVLRQALGREPTAAELYLAHQQGAGGASKLLSNPNAPAAQLVGADAVRLNGGDLGMTAGQFAGKWTGKFGGNVPNANAALPQIPTDQLMAALSNPWLDQNQRQVITTMLNNQMQAGDPMRQLQMQQAQQDVERGRIELAQIQQPQAQPRPLTPDERAFWNIPQDDNRPYAMGDDGLPKAIGGGGVNITNDMGGGDPSLGKLSTDFTYRTNPDGTVARDQNGLPIAVPVPGSPADLEAQRIAKAAERKLGIQDASTDTITTAASRARQAAESRVATGLFGKAAALNPSTPNAEIYRQVDVLKSNAKIDNLQAMRDSSPTGGALGAVTAPELKMLEDKGGALDPMSPNFLRDLDDYERTLLRTIHGFEEGNAIFEATRAVQPQGGADSGASGGAGLSDDDMRYLGGQ